MPAENQPKQEKKPRRRPRFWVGPLVAGSCFALGYGITQRVVLLQAGNSNVKHQTFTAQRFPGESLESLRGRNEGDSRPLSADVAAREAELAKTRPPKPKKDDKALLAAERIAAEARLRQQQAAATPAPVLPAAVVTVEDGFDLIPAPELPADPDAQPRSELKAVDGLTPDPDVVDLLELPNPEPSAPLAVEPVVIPVGAPAAPTASPVVPSSTPLLQPVLEMPVPVSPPDP